MAVPGYSCFFYCERSGESTPLQGLAPDAHYCVACDLHVCSSCWDATTSLCTFCSAASPSQPKGITAASGLEVRLSSIRGEFLELHRRRQDGDEPMQNLETERRLLLVRAQAVWQALERALKGIRRRDALKARFLLSRGRAEMESIGEESTVARRPPAGRDREWSGPVGQALQRLRRLPGVLAAAIPLLLVAALGVPLVADSLSSDGSDQPQGAVPPRETPEQDVAGAIPTASGIPPAASGNLLRLTFDEMITNQPVGSDWEADPQRETAVAVAFPNAVDRSLRVQGQPGRGSTTICRQLPPGTRLSEVSLDLQARRWEGASVRIGFIEGPRLGVEMSSSAVPSVQLGGSIAPLAMGLAADRWYRFSWTIDHEQRGVAFTVSRRDLPDDTQQVQGRLPDAWPDGETELCISSPVGEDGALYLDNLSVR